MARPLGPRLQRHLALADGMPFGAAVGTLHVILALPSLSLPLSLPLPFLPPFPFQPFAFLVVALIPERLCVGRVSGIGPKETRLPIQHVCGVLIATINGRPLDYEFCQRKPASSPLVNSSLLEVRHCFKFATFLFATFLEGGELFQKFATFLFATFWTSPPGCFWCAFHSLRF